MQRLRLMLILKKFFAVNSSVCNHFNQDCHFYPRKNFKLTRSATLAEWQQFDNL